MNIFDKRPLCLILCIWLGGFVFFSSGASIARISVLISAALLLTVFLVYYVRKNPKYIFLPCAIALILSALASHLSFGVIYNPKDRFDESSEVSAVVTDISWGQYSASLILKTESVNGERYRNRQVLLRISSTEARDISVGDKITLNGTFSDFEATDSFDTKSYYFSDHVCCEITDITELEVSDGESLPLSYKLKNMREYVRRQAIMLSNSRAGNLTSALLFGERESLSEQTSLDFTRIGISHLLALSGLHLTVLTLAISKVLSLLKVRKHLRYLISILFALLYMAFTGFSASVLRAGIMLIITYTLFLFAKAHDSITSLVSAVFIICLISPFSIYDTSLWLSAFATLGIIIFADIIKGRKSDMSIPQETLHFILTALLSSVFAITATLFITSLTFNTISVISPISTLIFSLLCEIIMYIGGIMLIIGKIIPIGKMLIPIVDFTEALASLFAKPRFILVSTDYEFLKILIAILTISFFLFLILKVKEKRKFIAFIVLLFVAINVTAVIISAENYRENDILYSSEQHSDSILVKSNNEVCLVNCAMFTKSSGKKAVNLLKSEHIYSLDKYIVTGYSWSLPDNIETLLSNISTTAVYVPLPRSSDESDILEMLFARLSDFNAKLVVFNDEEGVACGEFSLYRDYASLYGEGSRCALRIYGGGSTYTYLSSGMTDSDIDYPLSENIKNSDVLLFGGYGKKLSNEVVIDEFHLRNKLIVISTENLTFDSEAYLKYKENGCEIVSHPSKISILVKH